MRLYSVKAPGDVLNIIDANFSSLGMERIGIESGGNRVVAENIVAPEDVPGFDRSIVDGYAVKASDTFGASETLPSMLTLSGEVKMGEDAPGLPQGGCIYVPTGGMIPAGADAVVMLEDTEAVGDLVNCFRQVAPGENIIFKGEDVTAGDVVIERGRRLRAAEIGVLASLGIREIPVYRQPIVGIYSTGDEIVPYTTEVLKPGQIRDSNALAISELARKKGAVVSYGGILPDSYTMFRQGLEDLLAKVDFLLLSGGSSVGARDFTARVLQELSDNGLLVEGISIQPGKPTLLAKCKGKPVLGLPGHPVSALNIFSVFGTFLLDKLQGLEGENFLPTVKARLNRNIPSRPGRMDFVRVRLCKTAEGIEAVPIFGRSGLLRTLADAQGVVIVPLESEGLLAGHEIEVILWD